MAAVKEKFVLEFVATMSDEQREELVDELRFYFRSLLGMASDIGVPDAHATLVHYCFFKGCTVLEKSDA